MTHEMKLRREPFAAVASGQKVIELRLYDEKRRTVRVGDSIRFTCSSIGAAAVAKVRGIHTFSDFEALYDALLPRVGATGLGYAAGDAASPADMLDYYTEEEIRRWGVIGIEIQLEQLMMEDNKPILASGLPLPPAFLARMEAALGAEYPAFLASFAREVTPALRINPLKCAPSDANTSIPFLGERVAWQAAGYYYGEAAVSGDVRPGKHPLHEAGLYYIQEASAMLPASLCPPVPGERVLDLCAAPGGKASQLAGALMGRGLLIANEIHPGRAAILSQNMERMGVRNALVTNASPDELSLRFKDYFNKIVVDAPCSGEGMFRREADAVRMWSPENVALCAERQASILDAAASMVASGGYLTYSTCTFAPDENERTVMEFLLRHPDFTVVPSGEPDVVAAREAGLLDGGHPEWVADFEAYPADVREAVRATYRVLPHHARGEGHFAALLKRDGVTADTTHREAVPAESKKSKGGKPLSGKGPPDNEAAATALFSDFCREVFGDSSPISDAVPCCFGERLYFVPSALGETAAAIREALRGMHILRAGLSVGTVIGLERGRRRFEPDHALALAHVGTTGTFPVASYDNALAYLRGETLPAPGVKGWHIVTYAGLPLGWGKASDGIMKNHYPKGLRR